MKKLLTFIALFFAFGMPAKADTAVALLWIPSPLNNTWDKVFSQAASSNNFNFTIAVYDKMISAATKKKITSLTDSKQIEIALRIKYDPVLPLLYIPSSPSVTWEGKNGGLWDDRVDEAGLRIFDAYTQYENYFRQTPKGFVPAMGAVTSEIINILDAYSIRWTATAPMLNTISEDVKKRENVNVIAFNQISSMDDFDALLAQNLEKPAIFIVIDESDPTLDIGKARGLFLEMLNTAKNNELTWLTVNEALNVIELSSQEALKEFLAPQENEQQDPLLAALPEHTDAYADETNAALFENPVQDNLLSQGTQAEQPQENKPEEIYIPWSRTYDAWAANPVQKEAIRYAAKAVLAYSLLKNSSSLNRATMANADELIHQIEDNDNYFKLGNPTTRAHAEATIKNYITQLYRLMSKPVPAGLLQPFSESGEQEAQKGVIQLEYTQNSILFTNARKNITLPPEFTKVDETDQPQDAFEIATLEIRWTNLDLTFTVTVHDHSIDMFTKYADRFLIDIYIDQNKRAGFGLKNLLKDRNLITSNDNPWEYAVSFDTKTAKLYQSAQNAPVYLRSFHVETTYNQISATIPRYLVRGTPLNWAYMMLEMVKDESKDSEMYLHPMMFDGDRAYVDYMALDKTGRSLYFLSLPKDR